MSDRVLTSRSIDTLLMLTIVVVGALVMHVLLDMVRRYHPDAHRGRSREQARARRS